MTSVSKDAEEEDEDEEGHCFLLPGDEGFECDRPVRTDDDDEGEERTHVKGNGKRLMYHDCVQECNRLSRNGESDDQGELAVPRRRAQMKGPPKKRIRNRKVLLEDSDSEFEF